MGSIAAGFVVQGALVVTGIATTRTLGPTDRGYLALLVLVATVLQLVGTLGLPVSTTYFIARDRRHERSVLRAIRVPALIQVCALTIVQAAILWLLVRGEPNRVWWAAAITLPLLAGTIADMYGKAILQGQGRYTAFNLLRVAFVALYLVGVILLLAIGQTGLVEFTIAWVVAALVAGAVTLAVALGRHPPKQSNATVSRVELFRFGLKGYLVSLSPVATFRLDQALIGLFLPPRALGLYVAGLALTNLPEFIARGVGMIALPQVARATTTARSKEMERYVILSIALTGLVVVALELAAGQLVPLFFGSEFEDAVLVTRILLIGTFFWGVRRVLTDAAAGSGRPGAGSVAELVSWLAVVPALAFLMPLWGIEGAAAAITISSAASLAALALVLRFDGLRRLGSRLAVARVTEPVE
jgi:O-antigen/teichoic acid export membrane protein